MPERVLETRRQRLVACGALVLFSLAVFGIASGPGAWCEVNGCTEADLARLPYYEWAFMGLSIAGMLASGGVISVDAFTWVVDQVSNGNAEVDWEVGEE